MADAVIAGESPDLLPPDDDGLVIVGLGASAGGIPAFKEFFSRVKPDSGLAYVVILHLSPEHDSRLAEVLQNSAPIPVTQVTDAVRVVPDHVYVIPPNKSLSMVDGQLKLSEMLRVEERRAPVDVFFRTLAESKRSRAVCVILSGTGANGSSGLKRIKEYGGVAIVQDPVEAAYDDMPRHSMATGLVDYVLPVAEIPDKILSFRESASQAKMPAPSQVPESETATLREMSTILRTRTGHDFSNYKRATILRRIARRVAIHELPDLVSYVRYLRDEPAEARALLKDLLISVTHFFRDAEAFHALEETVVPRLFDHKNPEDQVRVWVAGCATGEEAYSVAMLLNEHASTLIDPPSIQVFASDLDAEAIARARDALYSGTDLADVSHERVRRHFTKDGELYRVRRELRESVLFAHHSLIKDPPFSHIDLVSCRNLLIYLNRAAQERVMDVLHFALRPGGYLFLGTSETVDGASELFVTLNKEAHIYQSRAVTTRLALGLPDLTVGPRPERRPEPPIRDAAGDRLSFGDLHLRLVEQFGPPSVLVNETHQIVHVSEHAGRFLKVPGGEPSQNLLRTIHPELRVELRTALYQAQQERAAIEARLLPVTFDDGVHLVTLTVKPVLRDSHPARGFFVVTFEEARREGEETPAEDSRRPITQTAKHLDEELVRLKEQLRATVEQYETQTEELKASNEELQAINEELRSAAEELETSKEELQSVNEELTTVNQELKIKIEELSQTNNDFQNLINSTDIGTIFLDLSLRVKLFTPQAKEAFNLIPADVGRPLSDITSKLVYADLVHDVDNVINRLQTVEREVQSRNGRWWMMRLLPYRTTENRINGVVMTFLDISERRIAEDRVYHSEERMRLLVESARDYAIFTVDPENRVSTWNVGAERMFGYREDEILGQSADILFTPEDRAAGVPQEEIQLTLVTGRGAADRWHVRKDGMRVYCSGIMMPLRDKDLRGFAKIARDLTGAKQAQTELEQAYAALDRRVSDRTSDLQKEIGERIDAEDRARSLVRHLVRAQEDERRRIARDLHDQLGQQVTGLRLRLGRLISEADGLPTDELKELQTITQAIDDELDFLAWELRPAALDDLGLAAALEE